MTPAITNAKLAEPIKYRIRLISMAQATVIAVVVHQALRKSILIAPQNRLVFVLFYYLYLYTVYTVNAYHLDYFDDLCAMGEANFILMSI